MTGKIHLDPRCLPPTLPTTTMHKNMRGLAILVAAWSPIPAATMHR
jgi:hypothetical protein